MSPNRQHAEHYLSRSGRVRRERAAVKKALAGFPRPSLPVRVLFVRCGPLLMDTDSLPYSQKALRDQVAEFLGVDDSPRETRVAWRYAQCKVRQETQIRERGRVRSGLRIWTQIKIEEIRKAV